MSENSNLSESARFARYVDALRKSWHLYKSAKADNDMLKIVDCQEKIHSLQEKLKLPKTLFLNFPQTRSVVTEDRSSWCQGRCSACGAPGVFWNGGKKTEHLCHKCNPLVIMVGDNAVA